jgi:hypothetical protein
VNKRVNSDGKKYFFLHTTRQENLSLKKASAKGGLRGKHFDLDTKRALIEQGVNPDVKKYLFLLYSSAANLLSFSGFTTKAVYNAVKGNNQTSLTNY